MLLASCICCSLRVDVAFWAFCQAGFFAMLCTGTIFCRIWRFCGWGCCAGDLPIGGAGILSVDLFSFNFACSLGSLRSEITGSYRDFGIFDKFWFGDRIVLKPIFKVFFLVNSVNFCCACASGDSFFRTAAGKNDSRYHAVVSPEPSTLTMTGRA